jgi:hypothetical protein
LLGVSPGAIDAHSQGLTLGHRWGVLTVVVTFTFAARSRSLLVLAALYRPDSLNEAEGRRHKTPVDLARILLTHLLHWFPERKFLPIGNCLMGHVNGPDAIALAWMNDVGVHQMIGYTVLTWYGYSGWGVLDYFVEQPGRYTLTEAFHANQHALIHRLDTYFDDLTETDVSPGARNIPSTAPNEAGKSLLLTEFDSRGLLWDRDTVAFCGDPAWQARMAPLDKAYDQQLTVDGDVYTLTITPRRGENSFKPVNTNGAQRGWRPIIELLDHRIASVEILEGSDLNPIITDDFLLIPNPRTVDPAREYRIRFTASRDRVLTIVFEPGINSESLCMNDRAVVKEPAGGQDGAFVDRRWFKFERYTYWRASRRPTRVSVANLQVLQWAAAIPGINRPA